MVGVVGRVLSEDEEQLGGQVDVGKQVRPPHVPKFSPIHESLRSRCRQGGSGGEGLVKASRVSS